MTDAPRIIKGFSAKDREMLKDMFRVSDDAADRNREILKTAKAQIDAAKGLLDRGSSVASSDSSKPAGN